MKFALTFPIADLRGKAGNQGNVVASNSKGINYFRPWVDPTKVATTNQTAIRSIFAQCAQAYKDIDSAQKAGWDTYAQTNKIKFFGKDITLSAMDMFVKVNSLRLMDGVAISESAPSNICDFTISGITSSVWVSGTSTLTTIFTHTATVTTSKLVMIKIGPTQYNNINVFPRNDLRTIKGVNTSSIIALSASPQTVAVVSPAYTPVVGQYLPINITPLSPDYDPGLALDKLQIVT